MNSNTKITTYVVKGIFEEDKTLCLERLVLLLAEKPELLELFVNGIPVNVRVTDENALIADIKGMNTKCNVIGIKEVKLKDFEIQVVYKYLETRYYKTEEEANKETYDYHNSPSDTYLVKKEVERANTISRPTFAGIDVEYK